MKIYSLNESEGYNRPDGRQVNILLKEKIDLDYLDMLYREKLRYGTKDEILIKLK